MHDLNQSLLSDLQFLFEIPYMKQNNPVGYSHNFPFPYIWMKEIFIKKLTPLSRNSPYTLWCIWIQFCLPVNHKSDLCKAFQTPSTYGGVKIQDTKFEHALIILFLIDQPLKSSFYDTGTSIRMIIEKSKFSKILSKSNTFFTIHCWEKIKNYFPSDKFYRLYLNSFAWSCTYTMSMIFSKYSKWHLHIT